MLVLVGELMREKVMAENKTNESLYQCTSEIKSSQMKKID